MNLIFTMIIIFVLGYLMIAAEHKTNISKSSVALVLCCLLWGLLSIFSSTIGVSHDTVGADLLAALGGTCEIIISADKDPQENQADVAYRFPDIHNVLSAGQYDHDHHHDHAHQADALQL